MDHPRTRTITLVFVGIALTLGAWTAVTASTAPAAADTNTLSAYNTATGVVTSAGSAAVPQATYGPVLAAVATLEPTPRLAPPTSVQDEALRARVRAALEEVPLIDGHNDVPWQYLERVGNNLDAIDLEGDTSELDPPMHTDFRRLRQGQVGGVFWSVYLHVDQAGPGAVHDLLGQIDVVHQLVRRYPQHLELALTADDVVRIHSDGRIASLIGMEGGHSIDNSLAVLRMAHVLGARYMTLTHGANTDWADSATDTPEFGGLTEFGREVVREMNWLGMLVDISHVTPDAMNDVLDTTEAPVIFSHSSAAGVVDYARNVPDQVLRRLPENGGVTMVNFVRSFVTEAVREHEAARAAEAASLETLWPGDPDRRARDLAAWDVANTVPESTLADVADHIDHVRDVAGVDHIGIGSDYDGISYGPVGLEDVSTFPDLFVELLRRGYSDEDIKKIAGLNVLGVMRQAEEVAARLQVERGPSFNRIEDLRRE
jgi:membrane dipeptidase